MGNPFIRSEAFHQQQPAPQEDPDKGILIRVPGGIIGGGAMTLPKAGPDQQENPTREVVVDAAYLGAVRITYRLDSYRHGRSRHWHWRAVRADPAGAAGDELSACQISSADQPGRPSN